MNKETKQQPMKLNRTDIGYASKDGRFEFERVAITTISGKLKHGWRLFFDNKPATARLRDTLDECKALAQDMLDKQPQPEPPTLVGGFNQAFRYIE
jgi:hypothetical protein